MMGLVWLRKGAHINSSTHGDVLDFNDNYFKGRKSISPRLSTPFLLFLNVNFEEIKICLNQACTFFVMPTLSLMGNIYCCLDSHVRDDIAIYGSYKLQV